jgi:hypothetical protein
LSKRVTCRFAAVQKQWLQTFQPFKAFNRFAPFKGLSPVQRPALSLANGFNVQGLISDRCSSRSNSSIGSNSLP